jgi:hypothetical protein
MNDPGTRIQETYPEIFLSWRITRMAAFLYTNCSTVPHLRPFIALDVYYCSSRYWQTSMISVGICRNNKVMLLRWAIYVNKEDYKKWRCFHDVWEALAEACTAHSQRRKDLVIMLVTI